MIASLATSTDAVRIAVDEALAETAFACLAGGHYAVQGAPLALVRSCALAACAHDLEDWDGAAAALDLFQGKHHWHA